MVSLKELNRRKALAQMAGLGVACVPPLFSQADCPESTRDDHPTETEGESKLYQIEIVDRSTGQALVNFEMHLAPSNLEAIYAILNDLNKSLSQPSASLLRAELSMPYLKTDEPFHSGRFSCQLSWPYLELFVHSNDIGSFEDIEESDESSYEPLISLIVWYQYPNISNSTFPSYYEARLFTTAVIAMLHTIREKQRESSFDDFRRLKRRLLSTSPDFLITALYEEDPPKALI